MRITIDTEAATLACNEGPEPRTLPLYSDAAFEILSRQWLKIGWNQKYSYAFSWLGRPLIQLPEDVMRIQEVIYRVQPDVIVETGVAHGGSLVLYASLLKLIGKGRVIGVDIEIRPRNRQAIEAHPLASLITLIEGSSTSPGTLSQIKSMIKPGESVFVILDSCHTKAHVRDELEAYHQLISPGSYIVATDGIMRDLHDTPLGKSAWQEDNPASAVREFVAANVTFVIEQPPWPFNESKLTQNITHWPDAFLRRL